MGRPPLVLLWIRNLKTKKMEWRSFQTSGSTRGIAADACIFIRQPTPMERHDVLVTMSHSAIRKVYTFQDLNSLDRADSFPLACG